MRLPRPLSGLLALLGLACAVNSAGLSDAPTVENFYRRTSVSVTVIGHYLYMDGGELSQLLDGKIPLDQNYGSNQVNSTISIDISKSWTTTADAVLRTIEKPWYSKSNEVIWTDEEEGNFYVWGGKWIRGQNMTKNELWKFTPDGSGGGAWALEPAANAQLFDDLHQSEWAVSVNTKDTGFSIGGLASGWTEKYRGENQAIPGMVAFNMKTKLWQNGTVGFSPLDTVAAGSGHYLPKLGPNGLIMILGGVSHPVVGNGDWKTARPYDLRNITFFDPITYESYWQIATGSVPPSPRADFCAAAFENPDGGYEILIMGGFNHRDDFPYGDAYILSLPGFVWTRVPDPGSKRRSAKCLSLGNRQMLSVGGGGTGWSDKDPAPQGLMLFDMTEMKWKENYDADAAAYERPAEIKSWYDNGSLDKVEWSSDQVRKLFVSSTDSGTDSGSGQESGQGTGQGSSQESSSPTTDPPATAGTPVGAIAGGVVGGVAGIAIIAAVAWFLIRRRRGNNAVCAPEEGLEVNEYYGSDATKPTMTATGFQRHKVAPSELTSERQYSEMGDNLPAIPYHAAVNHMPPVEMDATPTR